MTKAELVKEVCNRTEGKYSQTEVETIVSAAIDAVSDALQRGDAVKLKGFGVFQVVTRSARKVVPPGKSQPITVPPKKTVKFNVSSVLKDKVETA